MAVVKISNQAFFQELRQLWNQNPVVATLKARLRPMEIPIEVMQIANNLRLEEQQSAQIFRERQQMNDLINAQLGSMGVFGGSSSLGAGFGGPNPDDLMFYETMATIRTAQDHPQPVPSALVSQAAAILQGRVDPMQVYTLLGSQIPGYGQLPQGLMQMLGSMLGGMPPILTQQALVLAALTVPRDQIPGLLADPRVIRSR
jgi:hypothetical protein